PNVLIDAGANADARAEHLAQFAQMGLVLSQDVLGVSSPAVQLLSIGEEAEKGGELALEAHALLRGTVESFTGNTEGRDLLGAGGRVIVTDGFTGNVTLKGVEGTIKTLLDALRDKISSTARGKLGGLLIRPAARRLRTRLDPDTYGGAYLLGLRGLVVIAHGGSSSRAIENAVRLAARGVEHDVVGRLTERLGRETTGLESATSTTPTPQTRGHGSAPRGSLRASQGGPDRAARCRRKRDHRRGVVSGGSRRGLPRPRRADHGARRPVRNQDLGRGRAEDPDRRPGCRLRLVAPVALRP